jgi:hypothetical protein
VDLEVSLTIGTNPHILRLQFNLEAATKHLAVTETAHVANLRRKGADLKSEHLKIPKSGTVCGAKVQIPERDHPALWRDV